MMALVISVLISILAQSTVNDLFNRGQQALKENRYRDAIEAFDQAIASASPGNATLLAGLHYYKAAALSLSGDQLLAIANVRQAIHYNPSERAYQTLLSKIEQQAARTTIAAEEITRALRASRSFAVEGEPPSVDLWVNYEFDKDSLSVSGTEQAIELAKALQSPAFADSRFKLIGHTDTRGTAEYNRDLSTRRAERLRDYLVKQAKLDTRRIEVDGRGEENLKVQGDTEEAHWVNRRVEVQLLRGQ